MATVIDLVERLAEREGGGESRLHRAVERLARALEPRGAGPAPRWLATEILAIQGALFLGLEREAVERAERLASHVERRARTWSVTG